MLLLLVVVVVSAWDTQFILFPVCSLQFHVILKNISNPSLYYMITPPLSLTPPTVPYTHSPPSTLHPHPHFILLQACLGAYIHSDKYFCPSLFPSSPWINEALFWWRTRKGCIPNGIIQLNKLNWSDFSVWSLSVIWDTTSSGAFHTDQIFSLEVKNFWCLTYMIIEAMLMFISLDLDLADSGHVTYLYLTYLCYIST